MALTRLKDTLGRPIRCAFFLRSKFEDTLGRPIRCAFFLRFRWKKTPPPSRPEVMTLHQNDCVCRSTSNYELFNAFEPQKCSGGKNRVDKRHGGRADANVAEGGERRPSRRGVNTSLKQLALLSQTHLQRHLVQTVPRSGQGFQNAEVLQTV